MENNDIRQRAKFQFVGDLHAIARRSNHPTRMWKLNYNTRHVKEVGSIQSLDMHAVLREDSRSFLSWKSYQVDALREVKIFVNTSRPYFA